MSDKDQNKWRKRVPTRIYDYNYKYGESYYNPQTDFIENREFLNTRKAPPPEAASYGERFAHKPFYGSARGLPYDEALSAKHMPPPRRSVSASRSRRGSIDREVDDTPAPSRASRGRDRRISFSDDVKDILDEVAKSSKFSLDDDSDFKIPTSRFSFEKTKDLPSAADEFQIKPENKAELLKKFKDIESRFQEADRAERSAPRVSQYEHSAWNDELNIPGKKSVKRNEVTFTDPSSGAKVHKSSYSESSKFESSKPPRAPRAVRTTLNATNGDDFKLPPMPRARRISMSDVSDDLHSFSSKSISSISSSTQEDKGFRNAQAIRDHRRAQESEELTAKVNKMINKMKLRSDLPNDITTVTSRTIRASSLEPFTPRSIRASSVEASGPRSTIAKAAPRVKAQHFVYGYSR